VTTAQASRDFGVHPDLLRLWAKAIEADPARAFPGHGRMKPEQLEIDRLRRQVTKLKAERDILERVPKSAKRFSEKTRDETNIRARSPTRISENVL
jgi:transposase-like protein